MDTAAAILHAVADRFLVNIQADVIHTLHGGASLVVSESARSLSSAFVHQALLLTHTFKQSAHNSRLPLTRPLIDCRTRRKCRPDEVPITSCARLSPIVGGS